MSWKPEVMVYNGSRWEENNLRFSTKDEALANAKNLMMRWLAVTEFRATESQDPVNYRWNFSAQRLESVN